ncbi:MAG: hypothetical protein ABI599_11390 [Flavobacteriales bacterium]
MTSRMANDGGAISRSVRIEEQGRSGSVIYNDPAGSITFYWEFGGDDVIAIVTVGTADTWRQQHPWAVDRRADILRFVAHEVVRQKAPGSIAQLDDAAGYIHIRGATTPALKRAEAAEWMGRYAKLRGKLGFAVLVVGLIAAGFMWFKSKVLVIDPGPGTPIGLAVRTDTHIATLIESLVPYTPSLHRDASKDRYRVSVFLVPLDGSDPRLTPVTGELEGNSFSLAKILGSDGKTLWFDVVGIGGVDLKTFDVVGADDFRSVNPTLDPVWWEDGRGMEIRGRLRSTARDQQSAMEFEPGTLKAVPVEVVRNNQWPLGPKPEYFLAAGVFTSNGAWLGLHSPDEAARHFKPKSWLKRVVQADDAKEQRRFHRGVLDPDTSDGHHRIISMTALGVDTFLNGAFLRMDDTSEPIRLADPDGFLVKFTSKPGLSGTLVVARVDTDGKIIWKVDTGIDRFLLSQILPGAKSMAFVGPRPMVPDKVSEPILVIVDNTTGKLSTTSLWK